MQMCATCKTEKDFNAFHRNKSAVTGYYAICKSCRIAKSKTYRDKNKSIINEKWRESYRLNPTKHRDHVKKYQQENWENRKEYKRKWDKENPEKCRIRCAKRATTLRQATPPWLSKQQRTEMKWFYDTAKELQWLCNGELTVDHIEPLHGQNSSGLHVPWNLQIISRSANSKKGNKIG